MRRRQWPFIVMILTAGLGLLAWSYANKVAPNKIVVAGSPLMEPLVGELAAEFKKNYPDLEIVVRASDTVSALADLRDGHVQIAMIARPLKEDESDLVPHKIATDGLAIITNPTNPVASVTFDGMAEILKGEAVNWRDVGGHDAAIQVIHRPIGYSTTEVFTKYFSLNPEDLRLERSLVDNQDTVTAISENPAAIGYVSIGFLEATGKGQQVVNVLPLDGVSATSENIRNGSYPLIVPLNLVTVGAPEGLAKELIRFVQSQKGAEAVRRKRFIPNDSRA